VSSTFKPDRATEEDSGLGSAKKALTGNTTRKLLMKTVVKSNLREGAWIEAGRVAVACAEVP
jgi:hypothetical protein